MAEGRVSGVDGTGGFSAGAPGMAGGNRRHRRDPRRTRADRVTFSLTARCPETGMFGIAISSSSPAVAARCAHARSMVGAIASQNITDPQLGQIGLDLLARGFNAEEV